VRITIYSNTDGTVLLGLGSNTLW